MNSVAINKTPGQPVDYRGYKRKLERNLEAETFISVSRIYNNLEELVSQAMFSGRIYTINLFKALRAAEEELVSIIGTSDPVRNLKQLMRHSFRYAEGLWEYMESIGKTDEYEEYFERKAKPVAKAIVQAIKSDPELQNELELIPEYQGDEEALVLTVANAAAGVASEENIAAVLPLVHKVYLKHKAQIDKFSPSYLDKLEFAGYRKNLATKPANRLNGKYLFGIPKTE